MQGPSSAAPEPAPAPSGDYWRNQWQQFQSAQPMNGGGRQSGGGVSSTPQEPAAPFQPPQRPTATSAGSYPGGGYMPGYGGQYSAAGFPVNWGLGGWSADPAYQRARYGGQTDESMGQVSSDAGVDQNGDWRARWEAWRAAHPRPAAAATAQGDQLGDPARWQQLLSSGSYAALDPAAQSTLRAILGL